MNAFNALIFALMGSIMEILPMVFPTWFPREGADQASTHALWLSVMGAIQFGVGMAFILRTLLLTVLARISSVRATVGSNLPLPVARGLTNR